MRQGTTPTYTLTVAGHDLTAQTVYVTIQGKFGRALTLTGERLTVTADTDGSTIAFRLTQKETFALHIGTAEVQVRFIDAQGVALATNIATVDVAPVLLPDVIEYEGAGT